MSFLLGTHWGPDTMANAENPDLSTYGAIPLFWGTIFIGAIILAMMALHSWLDRRNQSGG